MSLGISPIFNLPASVSLFNVCCLESDDVYLDWARVLSCQYLSSEFNQCLPRSVSQFLPPICSEGITWCLPGSTQHLSCQCLFNGFDQRLSELVLTNLFLSVSVMRNLLMSIWTELACLLASIFLVSSISVCLEVSPNVFCQSVWRGHLMSSWINPMSSLSFLSDGFDQCLPELVLTCLFLPMSV